MYTLESKEQIILGGKVATSRTVVTGEGLVAKEVSVPAAKTGSLGTRTDNNTGVINMTPGHGIVTGLVDVYWEGGCRRQMSGTVATNAITVDGGSGDNLPTQGFAITAMNPVEEPLVVDGDSVLGIEMYADALGQIALFDAAGEVEHLAKELGGVNATDYRSFVWTPDRDATNPLAGDTVGIAFFSHGNSSKAATMRVQALVQ